jgi:Spy/CpxP family protein refolding chaperone
MNTEQITTGQKSTKKRTSIIIGGVLAGVLALGGVALAQGGGPNGWGRGHIPGMALMRAMERLDLTDQQELQLIKIRKNLHQQGMDARQEMAASVSQVLDEVEKPAPDAQKIHSIADQAIQRFSKVVHSGIDQLIAFHQTLTTNQRATLVQSVREQQARIQQWRQGKANKLQKANQNPAFDQVQ